MHLCALAMPIVNPLYTQNVRISWVKALLHLEGKPNSPLLQQVTASSLCLWKPQIQKISPDGSGRHHVGKALESGEIETAAGLACAGGDSGWGHLQGALFFFLEKCPSNLFPFADVIFLGRKASSVTGCDSVQNGFIKGSDRVVASGGV